MVAKVDIVERNGKEYLTINQMSANFNAGNFKINIKYYNVASIITNMVSSVVNSNWRLLKLLGGSTINRFVSDILVSILTPMMNEVSLQDIFNVNSTV